jgi:hypothetical protein
MIAGATSFTDLICGAPIERYDGQPVDNFNARPRICDLLFVAALLWKIRLHFDSIATIH